MERDPDAFMTAADEPDELERLPAGGNLGVGMRPDDDQTLKGVFANLQLDVIRTGRWGNRFRPEIREQPIGVWGGLDFHRFRAVDRRQGRRGGF
jgi:hypothetical protein